MTLNDVQRAALVLFAARAAGRQGSLEQMKAIAYCIRNRVRAGWFDGQWLTVMENAEDAAGNAPSERVLLDPNNRSLQRLVADVDDIYYGGRDGQRATQSKPAAQRFAPEGGDLEDAIGKSCYWCKINEPIRPWFKQHIIGQPEEHPNRATMGLMQFFD